MKRLLLAIPLLLVISSTTISSSAKNSSHVCTADASKRALPLLLFHSGNDRRAAIEKTVTVLPPVANPVDASQKLDVLEVMGHIYKGNYRLRFLYMQDKTASCNLVGQEVLELSRF